MRYPVQFKLALITKTLMPQTPDQPDKPDILDLSGARERLIRARQDRAAAALAKQFHRAMGWQGEAGPPPPGGKKKPKRRKR